MAEQKVKEIGGFRVLQEIQAGSGSQGTVYKAICEDSKHGLVAVGTVVALKVMAVQDEDGAQWRKLQKRTEELARLDHPNVVKYYGCFSERGLFNDVHVVVQAFLQGSTLKERLARQKTGLDVDEAVRIVDAALAGLEYTASRGLVHRDIKPGNIFICDDGSVKLIDFEIAKQEGGTATASVGNIRGSFDYMAPDFTNSEFRGDVMSDVFSMGVVLHEVLSGRTPYERLEGSDKQANFAFLSRWSQTLSGGRSPIYISSRIKRLLANADEVLLRALAPKREERYRDFASFRAGLKSIRFRSLKNGDTSYQLLQFIGKGGFGEVFKARDRKTGRLVAIKHLMKAAYAERFHREAKIMRKLVSSCFVQFVDFFLLETGSGQEAFLVMSFLDGMPGNSLRDAIKRRAEVPMEWRDVFVAFARYARGLLAMHQQGIYHRDIKPSNLYYPAGHPEASAIMDLGIARDVNGTATTGQVPGTLDYMPPEVVIANSRGDGGMDIYALGLCLYEALTGKMAFPRLPTGSTAYSTFFERARERRNPVFSAPEVQGDREVLSLLKDMTNPDASCRLRNAGVLLKRLEAIIGSRFKSEGGDENATIAPTVILPGEDVATIATAAVENMQAVAIEGERRRLKEAAKGRKSRLRILSLAAVALLVAAAAAAYHFRASIAGGFGSAGLRSNNFAEQQDALEAQRRLKEQQDALEAQRRLKEQQDALEAQRKAMEEQRKEIEAQQKAMKARQEKLAQEEAERIAKAKAEDERIGKEKKAREEAERRKAEEESARIAADKSKTAAEKAAETKRLAEEKSKREAEAARIAAEEKLRREKEEAEQAEARRKLKEQQDALEAQRKAMEAQRKEIEAQEKAMKDRQAKLAQEEAERIAKAKAEEERISKEKKAREEAERIENEKNAARIAEMERQLKEAQARAEKEKADREAEAKRLEAARAKAAEEARKLEEDRKKVEDAKKKASEEAERIAAERAAAEKARKEAEEKERKLEAERRKMEEAKKLRENTVKDLVDRAKMHYDGEDHYDVVRCYCDAVRNGHQMTPDERSMFEESSANAVENFNKLEAGFKIQMQQGRNISRDINEIETKRKSLREWYQEVTGKQLPAETR